jgi:starch synthase
MKIVHAASELYPYMKTGGLADAVGALVTTFAGNGHQVSAFLPGYRDALSHPAAAGAERKFKLKIEMGDQFVSGDVVAFSPQKNLTIYLICRDEYFDRKRPYGNGERDYEDNAERFIFFCKAVVETMRLADLGADIVHGHDWQAALLPLLLREAERRFGVTLAMKTVFTIHNIAYQGLFPAGSFAKTNLPDEMFTMDGLEYYGQVNFLKGGILFADRLTTVSPRYAKEIQSPEFGCGLEGVVQTRVDDLSGILNGIDTAVWNPATDPLIPSRYSAADLSGKLGCRRELLRQSGLDPAYTGPVFGMICRLTEQKGIDLLLANADFFKTRDCRLIVLGAGDKRMEQQLQKLAAGRAREGVRLLEARRAYEPSDRGGGRLLRDAVALRAVRAEPDVLAGLRHRADREPRGRPGRHRPGRRRGPGGRHGPHVRAECRVAARRARARLNTLRRQAAPRGGPAAGHGARFQLGGLGGGLRGAVPGSAVTPAIVWFRRDLRLKDNPALCAAARRGGPVIPVFVLDEEGEGRWAPGPGVARMASTIPSGRWTCPFAREALAWWSRAADRSRRFAASRAGRALGRPTGAAATSPRRSRGTALSRPRLPATESMPGALAEPCSLSRNRSRTGRAAPSGSSPRSGGAVSNSRLAAPERLGAKGLAAPAAWPSPWTSTPWACFPRKEWDPGLAESWRAWGAGSGGAP